MKPNYNIMHLALAISVYTLPITCVIAVLASNPIPVFLHLVFLSSLLGETEEKVEQTGDYTVLGKPLSEEDKGRWCCVETKRLEDGGEWDVKVKDDISNVKKPNQDYEFEIRH